MSLSAWVIIILFASKDLNAKNYYISSNGNDDAKGTSPSTAWKTINKVNSRQFKPGDSILFERNGVYHGQLEINESGDLNRPIVITSYGKGAMPVISGALPLTGWQKHDENIYYTEFKPYTRDLYKDDNLQTIARYPNSGFLTVDYNADSLHFTDNALVEQDGYWNGANVRIRTKMWVFETRKVKDFKKSTIHVEKHPDYPIERGFEYRHSPDGHSTIYNINKGWGYYLDNKYELIDSVGEWFQDVEKGKVYYYFPGGNTPRDIDAAILDFGVKVDNSDYIIIKGLQFEKYGKAAIHVEGKSKNLTVEGNKIKNISRFGVNLGQQSANCMVKNNHLHDIYARGITANQLQESIISGNTIRRIGLVPGYGWSGNFTIMGIVLHNLETKNQTPPYTNNNIVKNNVIDSIGYSGIRIDGYENTCEYNYLSNCMLTLGDGGALYSYARQWGVSHHNVYRNNIISNTVGNTEGTPSKHNAALAIYMDNYTHDMLIENNTVMNNVTSTGLLINDASKQNTIRGNNFYNNELAIAFSEWRVIGANYGNLVENNVVYCNTSEQKAARVANHKAGIFSPAIFRDNYYCSLDEKFYLQYQTYHDDYKKIKLLNGKGWQQELGQDLNSFFIETDKVDTYKEGAEIFLNPTREELVIELPAGTYYNFKEEKIQTPSITLQPYSSIILLKDK